MGGGWLPSQEPKPYIGPSGLDTCPFFGQSYLYIQKYWSVHLIFFNANLAAAETVFTKRLQITRHQLGRLQISLYQLVCDNTGCGLQDLPASFAVEHAGLYTHRPTAAVMPLHDSCADCRPRPPTVTEKTSSTKCRPERPTRYSVIRSSAMAEVYLTW